jgi:hypothetical protein
MNRRSRASNDDGDDWEPAEEHATGGYGNDDDFDYEEYLEREFPSDSASRSHRHWKQWIWRLVVVVICLLLIWRFLLW